MEEDEIVSEALKIFNGKIIKQREISDCLFFIDHLIYLRESNAKAGDD